MKSTESRDSIQKKVDSSVQGPSEEGKQMTPPAFQLKVAGDSGAEENPVQRKVASSGLPEHVQMKMESTMGADFSDVKVHQNSSHATEMGALAYTQGKDLHFAPGQFKPDTQSGQELIGHELAHVQQQAQGRVQPTTEVAGAPVNDDPGLENEADRMGQKAAQAKVDPSANREKLGNGGGSVQAKFESGGNDAPVQRAAEEQQGAEQGGDEAKPQILEEAQALAAEAGLTQLAMEPDQPEKGQQQAGAQGAGGESVQRKAGGPVVQRWGWLKKIGNAIGSGFKAIGRGISKAAGAVWDGIKWVGRGIAKVAKAIWKGAGYVAGYVWNVLKSVMALGHAWVIKSWGRIWKLIVHVGSGAWGFVKWLWDGIKTTFTNPGGLGKWFLDGLLGGLAWAGRLVTKVLDILGLAEILDLVGQIIKVNTRTLNDVEIAEAKRVFGDFVPYWKVRVDEYSLIAKLANWFKGSAGMGVTIGYTINFSRPIAAAAGNGDMHWLIHELTHVAQAEAVGLQYIPEALIAQAGAGYAYGGPAALVGKHLSDFNREQQGDICADYYQDVLYGAVPAASYQPLIDEAKRGEF